MKRILLYTILLVSVFQILTFEANAQLITDSGMLNSSLYREKLHIFTDRNLYASGEKVSFRLYNLSDPLLKENLWSTVLYLELINSRTKAVARGKYQVNIWGSEGQILIPDTVSTGEYYLRAYTRWMRNYPASDYFHLPLAIVNPRKIGSADLSAGGKRTGLNVRARSPLTRIVCSVDKSSYGKREKVSVQIHPESGESSPDAYCISVFKKGYLDEAYPYTATTVLEDTLRLKNLVFYPETRGPTVSGMVMVGEESLPADGYTLGMTMLGSDPDYFEFKTDAYGRFRIAVPQQTGEKDALLTIHSNRDKTVRVLMDEAYSSDFSTFPVPSVDFFSERRVLVEETMVNAQLREAFELRDKTSVDTPETNSEFQFYGTPEFRYHMDDYVTLPDLEEFFFEIVPQVQVENNQDHIHLEVLDDDDKSLYTPPLILLDHVPVIDIGKLLSVSPQQIDFIDIVNKLYVRGDNTYGGIVSIITDKGDRAGIELPDPSGFISFTGLSKPEEMLSPDYEGVERKANIPDLRNTLYWEARYEIAPNKVADIEFYTSDLTGEFMVVVRGITLAGDVLSGTCKFIVK